MRIYFSGNTGSYSPETILYKRSPNIMISFWHLQMKGQTLASDRGTKKRLRLLLLKRNK